ncbi:MAG: DUF2497 domain-containing protein [Rhodospirillales bacterium]
MSDSKPQSEPSMEEILASIRRIISEDGKAADGAPPAATREPPPEPPPEEDVLELTEALPDDEPPAPEPPPRAVPTPPPPPEAAAEEEIEIVDAPAASPEPEPEPAPEPVEEPPAPAPAPVLAPDKGGLISDPASDASAASFATLASRVAQMNAGFPLGQGNRTIEDLVKEVMRPMIKEWLDAHLPSMVERLVRREIDRIARRVDDD